MTRGVQVLDLTVICPLMRNVEGCGDGAAVGVGAAFLEQILVQALVQVVDGVVEGEQHDLGDLLRGKITCRRRIGRNAKSGTGGDGTG